MELSKNNKVLLVAYSKGYRVINSEVISPYSGKVLKVHSRAGDGRLAFTVSTNIDSKKRNKVSVHRLVAYQKFGEKMFELGIEVRHLDDNYLNNTEANIGLGTKIENSFDRPPEERIAHAINASNTIRKFTDVEMDDIRAYHSITKSYKDTMSHFNISTKSTLHRILNTEYVTTKRA